MHLCAVEVSGPLVVRRSRRRTSAADSPRRSPVSGESQQTTVTYTTYDIVQLICTIGINYVITLNRNYFKNMTALFKSIMITALQRLYNIQPDTPK